MRAVLVVDDDSKVLAGLAREIARMGHEPIIATTREAALEVIRTRDIGVLLVELRLSGIDLIRAAKRKSASTRALLMSAQSTPAAYKLALQVGAIDVLTKPIASDDFERAFRSALDASSTKSVIHQLNLVDLLQMMHLGMQSATIAVDPGPGLISMERGQVVHASYGRLLGLDALRYMVSLKSTSTETSPLSDARRNIDAPFEMMLLDVMREIDEASRKGVPLATSAELAPELAPDDTTSVVQMSFDDRGHEISDLTLDLGRRRRGPLAIVAGAMLVVAASVGAFAVMRTSEEARPTPAPAPTLRARATNMEPPVPQPTITEIVPPPDEPDQPDQPDERAVEVEAKAPRNRPSQRRTKRTVEPVDNGMVEMVVPVAIEELPSAPPTPAPLEAATLEPELEIAHETAPPPAPPPPPSRSPPPPSPPAAAKAVGSSDRAGHALTQARCGKCHSASYIFDAMATGIAPMTGRRLSQDEIKSQVIRCVRLPHSDVSKDDARIILSFLRAR